MWLNVRSGAETERAPGPFHHQRNYQTLQAAVLASGPGDTICLAAGTHTAASVAIAHPLRLLGQPGSSLVCHTRSAEALDVHANCLIADLRLEARAAACIRHHRGTLRIRSCHLLCDAQRLHHLYCALVTHASHARVSQAQERAGSDGAASSISARAVLDEAEQVEACSSRLDVAETRIQGSLRVVQCRGNATPQHVRVILSTPAHVYWFSVAGVVTVPGGAGWAAGCAAPTTRGATVPSCGLLQQALLEKGERHAKRRRLDSEAAA